MAAYDINSCFSILQSLRDKVRENKKELKLLSKAFWRFKEDKRRRIKAYRGKLVRLIKYKIWCSAVFLSVEYEFTEETLKQYKKL